MSILLCGLNPAYARILEEELSIFAKEKGIELTKFTEEKSELDFLVNAYLKMKCGINQNELKKSAEDSFGTARRLRDYAGHIKEKKSKGSVKEEKMASREIFKSIVNQYIDSAEYCFALEILNSSNEAGKKKYLDFMDKCLSRALSSAKAGAPDYFRKKNFLRTRELYNLLNEYSRVEPERANERVGLSKKIYGNADFKLDVGELILDELIVMKRGHKDVKSCEEKIRRLAGMIGHNPDRFIRSFYPKNI